MAARDARFYRILFKAVDRFQPNKTENYTLIEDQGQYFRVFKRPYLKFFRIFTSWHQLSKITDDNQLLDGLFNAKRVDQGLVALAQPQTSPTLPGEFYKGLDEISKQDIAQQEQTLFRLTNKIEADIKTGKVKIDYKPPSATAEIVLSKKAGPSQVPAVVKNIASKGQILIRRFVVRFPILVSSLVSGGFGALIGGALTGTVQGAAIGAGVGAGIPPAIKLGAGRAILGLGGKLLSGGALAAGAAGPAGWAALAATNKWIVISIIAVVVLVLILIPMGLLKTTSILPPQGISTDLAVGPPLDSSTLDIANCDFYRTDKTVTVARIGNPDLAKLIHNVAVAAGLGVSPVVLAAIIRIENPPAFVATNPDYLTKDYDAHSSSAGAIGAMQFMPATFIGTFEKDKLQFESKFLKIGVKEIIDPFENKAPDNILRIYSVKDSIIAAAFKIKQDKRSINGDGLWDEGTVKEIARRYHGACPYPTGKGSYCDDVWQSYTKCQPAKVLASCPLTGKRVIGCGSFMSDPKFNRNVCAGPESIDRGHCGRSYGYCFKGSIEETSQQRLAHSIDVDGKAGEIVHLPTIGNRPVEWQVSEIYPVASGRGGGLGIALFANFEGDRWIIDLQHVDNSYNLVVGTKLTPGAQVATIAATSYTHLHTSIGKNPRTNFDGPGWLDPESLNICTN